MGHLVMDALRELDQVAYVRFASVYRDLQDVNQFLDELKPLLGQAARGGGAAAQGARASLSGRGARPAAASAHTPRPNDKPAGSPHGATQP